MFYCDNCETIFEDPYIIREDWGDNYCCPNCETDCISDAVKCKLCGDYMAAREDLGKENVCEQCEKDLKARFKELLEEGFDSEEIDILCDIYSEIALNDE